MLPSSPSPSFCRSSGGSRGVVDNLQLMLAAHSSAGKFPGASSSTGFSLTSQALKRHLLFIQKKSELNGLQVPFQFPFVLNLFVFAVHLLPVYYIL